MRRYVFCVRCGEKDSRPGVFEEALEYHRARGWDSLNTEPNGDLALWDVCPDCCEVWENQDRAVEWFEAAARDAAEWGVSKDRLRHKVDRVFGLEAGGDEEVPF